MIKIINLTEFKNIKSKKKSNQSQPKLPVKVCDAVCGPAHLCDGSRRLALLAALDVEDGARAALAAILGGNSIETFLA